MDKPLTRSEFYCGILGIFGTLCAVHAGDTFPWMTIGFCFGSTVAWLGQRAVAKLVLEV